MPENVTPLRPKRPCPECGKPSAREAYPFCSERCKNVDLGRWLTGSYVLPGVEDGAGESDGADMPGEGAPDAPRRS